ncbi:hypothetical protein AMJ57_01415 [Parcubacteria bacterium SG8_24]|nr:MAG: hypothetical protein AMJ57_01415 [Parcubacteria bacterium SG8_24]
MGRFSPKKYTFFLLFFTAAGLTALFVPAGPVVRGILALFYLLGNGHLAGRTWLRREGPLGQTLLGSLILAAALIVGGSAVYYLYRLDLAAVTLIIAVIPFLLLLSGKPPPGPETRLAGPRESGPEEAPPPLWRFAAGLVLALAYLYLIVYGFEVLGQAATEISIRSPWDVVPRLFLVLIFVTALGIFPLAWSGSIRGLTLIPAVLFALLSLTVAAIVYRVGFGFDPFIHQATETAIFRSGLMEPKPFYYIGQYATVTMIARLLGGHVRAIDTFLVPSVASLVLPVAYWSLRRAFRWDSGTAAGAALLTLCLPLTPFIMTTPQGLANALLLMTMFLALAAVTAGAFPKRGLLLLGAATAAVHPLAGIPLLIFLVFLVYLDFYERLRGPGEVGRWFVLLQLVIFGSIALPVVFLINSQFSDAGVTLNAEALRSPTAILEELRAAPQVATRKFMAAYDLVYSWKAVRTVALFAAGLAGLVLLHLKRRKSLLYAATFVVFFLNYLLLKTVVSFPFLIDYERSNYADRMFDLTLLLLTPLTLFALGSLLSRIRRSYPALRVGAAVLVAVIVTASVYLAYPRRDQYESSRGWSTSSFDVSAVRLINDDAAGRPYVVLANQSVSAAAVGEFGFRRYYASQDPERPGDIFYYPIPTGGPLYEIFLEMNATDDGRETARRAARLAGVETVYYVVNHYWYRAQHLMLSSRRDADSWWSVEDSDFVFRYDFRGGPD